jgi:hypothetical protein
MRPELVLDAADRAALRHELARLGLLVAQADGNAPLRVALDGHSAQKVVRSLEADLTQLTIREPTLEETYLRLVEEGRA